MDLQIHENLLFKLYLVHIQYLGKFQDGIKQISEKKGTKIETT